MGFDPLRQRGHSDGMNQSATTPPAHAPDMAAMEADYRNDGPARRSASSDLLPYMRPCITGNEKSLVRAFMHAFKAGMPDENIPWLTPDCTVVNEYRFAYGRADIVIFHTNGSATVIEAKDGKTGYTAVVAGIGQCGLYASQLMAQKAVKRVHRALMYSSTRDINLDMLIEDACFSAGVIPLSYPASDFLEQIHDAVIKKCEANANGST